MYVWEHDTWPDFRWKVAALLEPYGEICHRQGRLYQSLETLGFDVQLRAQVEAVTAEALGTALIEGQKFDLESVRSSVARRLGMPEAAVAKEDRNADGLVELVHDATRNLETPLETDRFDDWHAALFPTGRSGLSRIKVGEWRDDASGPMQVMSGAYGREKVHYEAPPADRLADEMGRFLEWFNNPPGALDGLLRVGVAHFWFVTIHPYEDGNGRLARAVADRALAQWEGNEKRFYSVSAQIQEEKNAYYAVLEKTQKGDGDLTEWLLWFLGSVSTALVHAEQCLQDAVRWSAFWQRHAGFDFNERHRKVFEMMRNGVEGPLTPKKWKKYTNISVETAQRDLRALEKAGIVRREGKGRGTKYHLVLEA